MRQARQDRFWPESGSNISSPHREQQLARWAGSSLQHASQIGVWARRGTREPQTTQQEGRKAQLSE